MVELGVWKISSVSVGNEEGNICAVSEVVKRSEKVGLGHMARSEVGMEVNQKAANQTIALRHSHIRLRMRIFI